MSLQVVILAGGQGKRMHSDLPKVLHPIGGKAMLSRVVDTAQQLNSDAIHVIVGHGAEHIKETLADLPVNWILQKKQLGTGHALMQALPFIPSASRVLVLSGDVPLIQVTTLQLLIESASNSSSLALLLALLEEPSGLGRIVRDPNRNILSIVEEKDATSAEKEIKEIYSGICCAQGKDLQRWLPALTNNNQQKEYYLTDIIQMAVNEKIAIHSIYPSQHYEIQGINNRLQLQQLERAWQKQKAEELLLQGVSLADASRIDIRGELLCGKDVFIDVNVVFKGKVILGEGCVIGPNCILNNVTLGAGCEIQANSVLEGCMADDGCTIGPFARIRPGTRLAKRCKIGNFVETKNAVFGEESKASHLSYLGDVSIGQEVNIGAGTITCNYDGANKHQTIIEDGVFIGSDTQLVAPVTIGRNATIGAGSTIRKNVPPQELTLTESKQKTVTGWQRPKKK